MNEIHFLDESSFTNFLVNSNDPNDDLTNLIDLADSIFDRKIAINSTNQLDYVQINQGLQVYEICFINSLDNNYGIDRDTAFRFSTLIRKLTRYETNNACNAQLKDTNGVLVKSITNSYSANLLKEIFPDQSLFSMVMIDKTVVNKEFEISSPTSSANIFAVSHSNGLTNYFRCLISKCAENEHHFFQYWDLAFPNCLKADDLTFGKFRGNYSLVVKDTITHLSFLNDNYQAISEECNHNFPEVINISSARHGISLSNESAKTRGTKWKMNLRNAQFDGAEIKCECHTKLSPTYNRIHFKTPDTSKNETKMFIGIFVEHLVT